MSLYGRMPLISAQLVEQFVLPQYPGNETAESRNRINGLTLSQIQEVMDRLTDYIL
jgi:hypothetical protein